MQVKIKSIYINDKKKTGEPFVDRNGNPYKMASLETEGGKKLSMFIGQKFGQKDLEVVQTWKPGQTVDIMVEQNGDYWNFKLPSKVDLLDERVKALEQTVYGLKSNPSAKLAPSTDELDVTQIPF